MRNNRGYLLITVVVVCLALFGCNLPTGSPTSDEGGTIVVSTLGALQTSVALTQASPRREDTPTLTPLSSLTPPGTAGILPSRQTAFVKMDALCWVGPGDQFEVVSAILTGKSVDLLGRGTIPGWYIVRNPVYQDPCWIQSNALEIPPGTDVSGLPYFSPPATPTATPTKTPINTPTNTATPTNTP